MQLTETEVVMPLLFTQNETTCCANLLLKPLEKQQDFPSILQFG